MTFRWLVFPFAAACTLSVAAAQQSSSGIDLQAIDKSVSACDNFYQYACGTWMKTHPIPPDQSTWGRFNELHERNLDVLHNILEQAAKPTASRTPDEQKIGDDYASCMDEQAINQLGTRPIQPLLDTINTLADKKALTAEIARLHREGVPAFFGFSSEQDAKNSSEVIAGAGQGGLGLPDRDYYLKTDPKSVELRQQYVAHVQKMLALAGRSPAEAATQAQAIMALETALAKASLDRVSLRDPNKTYHRMTVKQLAELAPAFDWTQYLSQVGAPAVQSLNVAEPDFFKGMQQVVATTNLPDLKAYLAWHVIHDAAPLLPTAFVAENFNFYGKTLTGAKELRPRWKRCVNLIDAQLGEALGKTYVQRTFGQQGKERTLQMVRDIEKEMGKDIDTLPWMTPETKKAAFEKLHAVANKIGYPDQWRDYSSVKIVRNDAFGNATRASAFEVQRQLNKIGKPVDKKEWLMTPPTVNAYYDPQMNNINFPAGILQPPFYSNKADEAVNFGAIGAVVGHELTHGFDDEGRQFDAQGNLRDWWTAKDGKEFDQRAECIAKEYGNFTAVGDVKLNGKLTLGENAADNGGVRLAFMALMDSMTQDQRTKQIDGYTPEQRFFLGFAQVWCQNQTDETSRLRAQTDPHSPGRYRVNGVMQNMPEFQQAFGCKAGQPMVSENRCRIW